MIDALDVLLHTQEAACACTDPEGIENVSRLRHSESVPRMQVEAAQRPRRLMRVYRDAGLMWCKTMENHIPNAKRASNQLLKGTSANHHIASRNVAGISLWLLALQRFEYFLFNEGHIARGRIRGCIASTGRIKAIAFDPSLWHQMRRSDGGHRRTGSGCNVH